MIIELESKHFIDLRLDCYPPIVPRTLDMTNPSDLRLRLCTPRVRRSTMCITVDMNVRSVSRVFLSSLLAGVQRFPG